MSLHFVNSPAELFDLSSSEYEIRSVLLLCDAVPPSYARINAIHSWMSQTPDEPKKYACFAGKFSELAHDTYDEIDIALDRFSLTTWHVNESAEDTAFFFLETIPMCNKGADFQVVVGVVKSPYENKLVELLNSGKP